MVAEAEAGARPPEPRAWSGRPGAAGAERTLSPGSRGRAPPTPPPPWASGHESREPSGVVFSCRSPGGLNTGLTRGTQMTKTKEAPVSPPSLESHGSGREGLGHRGAGGRGLSTLWQHLGLCDSGAGGWGGFSDLGLAGPGGKGQHVHRRGSAEADFPAQTRQDHGLGRPGEQPAGLSGLGP